MPKISSGGLPAATPPKPRRPKPPTMGKPATPAPDESVVEQLVLPAGWYDLEPTGELCQVCLESELLINPVYRTPSGPACPDGHTIPTTYVPATAAHQSTIDAAWATYRAHQVPIGSFTSERWPCQNVAEVPEAIPGCKAYALQVLAEEILNTDDEVAAGVLGRVIARVVLGRELEK